MCSSHDFGTLPPSPFLSSPRWCCIIVFIYRYINRWAKCTHSWLPTVQIMDIIDGRLAVGTLADNGTFLALLTGTHKKSNNPIVSVVMWYLGPSLGQNHTCRLMKFLWHLLLMLSAENQINNDGWDIAPQGVECCRPVHPSFGTWNFPFILCFPLIELIYGLKADISSVKAVLWPALKVCKQNVLQP